MEEAALGVRCSERIALAAMLDAFAGGLRVVVGPSVGANDLTSCACMCA